jgi:hypothetical protein
VPRILRRVELAGCLAVYVLLSVLLFDPKLYTGGDNAVYLVLARSLATGQGFTNLHLPGKPAQTDYPPGFPALLAAQQCLFGPGVIKSKLLVMLFGLGAALYTFLLLQRTLGAYGRHAAWFALSVPPLITYNHWVLTEVPFLAVSVAALYFLHLSLDGSHRALLPGLVLTLVALTFRVAGLALVLGVVLALLFKRRWLALVVFSAASATLVGLWVWRNAGTGAGSVYLNQLLARDPYVPDFGRVGITDVAQRAGRNFLRYAFTVLPGALLPLASTRPVSIGAGTVLSGLCLLGVVCHRRRFTVVEAYAGCAAVMLLFWPEVWSDERFLVPLLPLVIIFIGNGLVWIEQRLKRSWLAAVVLSALAGLNVVSLGQDAVRSARNNLAYLRGDRMAGYSLDWRRYFECIEWLKGNTSEDAVILARKPEFVFFLSGRRSLCYPFTNDRARVRAAVLASDYVLFDNFRWTETGRHFLNPVLADDPGLFELVRQTDFPQFFILRVNRP